MHQFLYGVKEGFPVFPTNWKVLILAFYLIIHYPPKSNIVIHQLIICDYYCLPCPTVKQSQFPHRYRLLCIFLLCHDSFFLSRIGCFFGGFSFGRIQKIRKTRTIYAVLSVN